MPAADAAGRGVGELDVYRAFLRSTPVTAQTWSPSTGLGSMEQARGTQHVADDGTELTGEQHILGAFDATTWAPASAGFKAWTGGTWAGGDWTSACWCGTSWTGKSWSGKSWSGTTWAGKSWSGQSWSGKSWSGKSWSGASWHTSDWASSSWVGKSWSGTAWAAAGWDGT